MSKIEAVKGQLCHEFCHVLAETIGQLQDIENLQPHFKRFLGSLIQHRVIGSYSELIAGPNIVSFKAKVNFSDIGECIYTANIYFDKGLPFSIEVTGYGKKACMTADDLIEDEYDPNDDGC